jgi:hypothetical protein
VNQGHNGEQTHKGEWAYAWDFVIINSELKQFCNEGNDLSDYLCFGQKVIAPADGTVVVIEDGIEDNNVGEVNIHKNWGNTVIIKHAEGLYSKLSHLQKGSIDVKVGDYIHYGHQVGRVGNSGRSPYPHLHFQLQSTPYIGSKTLKYPLFAYLEDGKEIKTFSYPVKGQRVRQIDENTHLKKAFNLMPGTKLNWKIKTPKGLDSINWEVFTTPYNRSYIYCNATKSIAYFNYDGVYFYFTHFEGNRKSLLYLFYLAAFRIPLVQIDNYVSIDSLPLNQTFKGWRLFLHDFNAPFHLYLKTNIETTTIINGSEFDAESFEYKSKLFGFSFNQLVWAREFNLTVNRDNSLKFEDKSLKIEALCDSY